MTEGIIKKVVDSWFLGDTGEYIKQELISEIKMIYPICCGKVCIHNKFICPNWEIQKTLIGDNQQ